MASINFFIQDIKFNLKNKNALRRWLVATVKKEGYKIAALNYIFSSDKFLHQLNQQFLHHDSFTDIITFNLSSSTYDLQPTISDSQRPNISGEVFISIERVKENTTRFKTTFVEELHRVIIHGVLHLIGYKDKTKSDKTKMREKENYYLNLRSF
ncbi:MAG: rRNA maturation RNase YbeY [Bacteroidota bacterium]